MNAQQRRKKRRLRDHKSKFEVGNKVRIHHRHQEQFDTTRVLEITGKQYDNEDNAMYFISDHNDNSYFTEDMLVHNTKDERRRIF